jgi:hypothetical protein
MRMGKKHSGIKTKGGFKEINKVDAPQHVQDMLNGGKEVTDQKAISGRRRDFVKRQKEYHLSCIGVHILGAELEVFMEQMKMKPEERTIKWNGMVMPQKVLAAHTILKNAKYVDGIHEKHSIKKSLLNDGLTEEEIEVVGSDAKYVLDLPVKINLGEAGDANI